MNKMIWSLALWCLTSLCYAQGKGIRFENTLNWEQIRKKATAEKKFIFLDVYASWCAPCKFMNDSVYTSDLVGRFMNDRFLSIKIKMDSAASDRQDEKEWRKVASNIMQQYGIETYPSLLFFDKRGQLVHRMAGALRDSTFIKVAGNAIDPNKQYYTLLDRYRNGKLPFTELPALARFAKYLNDTSTLSSITTNYIDNFLLKLNNDQLLTKENLGFISEFLGNTDSRSFDFYVNHRDQINGVLGRNKAEYAIRSAISKQFIPKQLDWTKDKPDWDNLEKMISQRFGPLGQEMIFGKRMIYSSIHKEWKNYTKYYKLYLETALARPEWNINDLSWTLFENVNDLETLKYATDTVMRYAMAEWYQNDLQAYDTYANLLYKIGRTELAIKWEERALKAAKGTPSFEKQFGEVLEKMKKGVPTWIISVNN